MEISLKYDTAEELQQTLEVLRSMICCSDFSSEKKPLTNAERQKKYRESKKVSTITNSNEIVTENNETVTEVTEKITESNEIVTKNVEGSFINNILKNKNNSLENKEENLNNSQKNLKINEIKKINEPENERVTENVTNRNEIVTNQREIVTNQENPVSKKQKLTPNDDDFWNVFKGEKERAQAFFKATGIYPVNKSEFGRWQKELPTFTESNISIDVMIQAIESLANSPITIAAPGSVFTTARSLANRPNIRVKPQQPEKKESFSEVAKRIQAERDSGQRSTFMDVFFGNRQKTEEQKMEIIDV